MGWFPWLALALGACTTLTSEPDGGADHDGDGYGADADCDDTDPAVHPGAEDPPYDGVDSDCAGDDDWDVDGDGYAPADVGYTGDLPTGDCDDGDASANPAATEQCNGSDDDCDGRTDEPDAADASTFHADADADGYGDAGSSATACESPSGYVVDGTDCDDTDAAVNPAADELCDGAVDEDCDGIVDEGDAADASTFYVDVDGDGYGDPSSTTTACEPPAGYVADPGDCDDTTRAVSPLATEDCHDGVDQDCDALLDCEDADCGSDPACVEAVCDDGLDDDGDGLTDCEDEDCWSLECYPVGVESWVTGGRLMRARINVHTTDTCAGTSSSEVGTLQFSAVTGKARVLLETGMGGASVTTCDWTVTWGAAGLASDGTLVDLWRASPTVASGCRLTGTSWMPAALAWDDAGAQVVFDTTAGGSLPWYRGSFTASGAFSWTVRTSFSSGRCMSTAVTRYRTYVYDSLGGSVYTASP